MKMWAVSWEKYKTGTCYIEAKTQAAAIKKAEKLESDDDNCFWFVDEVDHIPEGADVR